MTTKRLHRSPKSTIDRSHGHETPNRTSKESTGVEHAPNQTPVSIQSNVVAAFAGLQCQSALRSTIQAIAHERNIPLSEVMVSESQMPEGIAVPVVSIDQHERKYHMYRIEKIVTRLDVFMTENATLKAADTKEIISSIKDMSNI